MPSVTGNSRPGLVQYSSICSVMFIDFPVLSIGREIGR